MPKPRKFEGYGVITRHGQFLWQYCRPEEQATKDAYEAHNPQVEGHEEGYKIVRLAMSLFD